MDAMHYFGQDKKSRDLEMKQDLKFIGLWPAFDPLCILKLAA